MNALVKLLHLLDPIRRSQNVGVYMFRRDLEALEQSANPERLGDLEDYIRLAEDFLERLLKVRDSFNEESQLFFDDSVTLSVEVTKICGKDMVSGHVPLVQEAEAKITGDIDTFLKHPIDQLTVFIERAKNIKAQISMK